MQLLQFPLLTPGQFVDRLRPSSRLCWRGFSLCLCYPRTCWSNRIDWHRRWVETTSTTGSAIWSSLCFHLWFRGGCAGEMVAHFCFISRIDFRTISSTESTSTESTALSPINVWVRRQSEISLPTATLSNAYGSFSHPAKRQWHYSTRAFQGLARKGTLRLFL